MYQFTTKVSSNLNFSQQWVIPHLVQRWVKIMIFDQQDRRSPNWSWSFWWSSSLPMIFKNDLDLWSLISIFLEIIFMSSILWLIILWTCIWVEIQSKLTYHLLQLLSKCIKITEGWQILSKCINVHLHNSETLIDLLLTSDLDLDLEFDIDHCLWSWSFGAMILDHCRWSRSLI